MSYTQMRKVEMKKQSVVLTVLLCLATGALAHQGVKNAAVKARMDAMSAIGKNMKVLGGMAKGETPFDPVAIHYALEKIEEHAANTPGLFKAQETDPKSESKPAIWTDFPDFTRKANALETVAAGLSRKIDTAKDLGPALNSLGETCKSCHELYREERE